MIFTLPQPKCSRSAWRFGRTVTRWWRRRGRTRTSGTTRPRAQSASSWTTRRSRVEFSFLLHSLSFTHITILPSSKHGFITPTCVSQFHIKIHDVLFSVEVVNFLIPNLYFHYVLIQYTVFIRKHWSLILKTSYFEISMAEFEIRRLRI